MKTRIFSLAAIALTLSTISFFSCSDEPTTVEPTISLAHETLKPSQISSINVSGMELKENSYTAQFGSTEILASKVSPFSLVFLTPDVNPGSYTIKLEVNNKEFSAQVMVESAGSIADPAAFVADFINEANASYEEFLQDQSLEALPAELAAIKEDMHDAYAEFNQLPESDKLVVARFIDSNSRLIADVEEAYTNYMNAETPAKKSSTLYRLQNLAALTISGVLLLEAATAGAGILLGAVVIETAYRVFKGKSSPVFNKIKSALKQGLSMAYYPQNYLSEVVFDRAEKEFANFFEKKSTQESVEFFKGNQIVFNIKPTYRSIGASDAKSSDPVVSSLVNAIEKLKVLWNASVSGYLGNLPEYEDVEEQKYGESISNYKIRVTRNSKVTVGPIEGTPEAFTVSFNTTSSNNESFTFEISYTEKGVTAKQTVDAVLISGYQITGVTFSNWKDIGVPCPSANLSGMTKITIQFAGSVAPKTGILKTATDWDNTNDGVAEGTTGWAINHVQLLNVANNTIWMDGGFCWGLPSPQVLRLRVQYVDEENGVSSNIFERSVPRP
jgi:hypothetical protein